MFYYYYYVSLFLPAQGVGDGDGGIALDWKGGKHLQWHDWQHSKVPVGFLTLVFFFFFFFLFSLFLLVTCFFFFSFLLPKGWLGTTNMDSIYFIT